MTAAAVAVVGALSAPAAFAQDQADLAKAAQNPVAAMISLPFQTTPRSASARATTPPTCSTSSR
jgi:hypothetical protein